MEYIYTIIAINLLVWIPWLWIYKAIPYFTKNALKRKLASHQDYQRIKRIELQLTSLYNKVNPAYHSRKDIRRLGIKSDDFIYGEIDFLSFFGILERTQPQPQETFYDLGCGAGKAVFAAALYFNFKEVYGIELLPALYTLANHQLKKARAIPGCSRIRFINDDFLSYDFSAADIIFINATCLGVATWAALTEKLMHLKPGSRIIVVTKRIEHPGFKLIYQGTELMSWGKATLTIYLKK